MIRILFVTTLPPSQRSGGGLHCYANLRALCQIPGASVSYVGPEFKERLDGLESLCIGLARPFRFRDKVVAFMARAATSLAGVYAEWRRSDGRPFDVAFVESTKAGFAVVDLRKKCPVLCSVQNVEVDYLDSGTRGTGALSALNVRRSEEASLRHSDRLLVLHRQDLARLRERYRIPDLERRALLHPVCALGNLAPLAYEERKRRIIISGALDQPYNEHGTSAFLRECWPSLRSLRAELVIAGRNPRPVLVDEVRRAGATMIANPDSMPELVREAAVALVPDLGGAGMKLKVAEALSLAVPVVGTTEGMLGYDDANEFGRVVPDIRGMADAIREIMSDPEAAARMASRARIAWEEHYSYPAFARRVEDAIREVVIVDGAGLAGPGTRDAGAAAKAT